LGLTGYGIFAQNVPEAPSWRTAHYEIYGVPREAAERLGVDLEGRFAVYLRLFRFNPALLGAPLTVRLIPGVEDYDAYIRARLGETRPGAVYLHYNQVDRRELVVNYRADGIGGDAIIQNPAFSYQVFIQYLRAFIPHPPSWIQEGFAIYFNTLEFSATGELGYTENLTWLETVKKMTLPPAEAILLADLSLLPETALPAQFPLADLPALSWSLVSFFLNSGHEDYFRARLECLLLLTPAR
jgi:uncharacterized short protein YbdD (DUF466 family)